ncbi:MAG TPA: phosphoglycerate dehydrogenase [Verrucomicrobiae bacterium]|nr:phosphoglycerate dehydrogenase [Verrucomicrobiae bacterium]
MTTMKILISDPISERGVQLLQSNPAFQADKNIGLKEDQLCEIIGEYDALVVRSQTKVTRKVIDAAKKLRVIGRAGVGVDNVDVDAATRRGIIVMNTPGGNTISTAEHTFSMMMALARKIPQAHASVKAGKWDRKSYEGVELYSKTLGIIGMGRIGGEVARRAIAFGMRVLAHDPFLSMSRAKALQVEVVELDEMYARADFITVHVPITEQTRGMINQAAIAKMKKGVRLINCARGGVINEKDLYDAIRSGHVAGAALDVYEKEPPADSPLRELDAVVMTPHLGASTHEAQESVGTEIAEQIAEALTGGTIRNAVNMPSIDAKVLAVLQPYLTFGEKMGRLLAQLAPPRVERITIEFCGKAGELESSPISRAVLKGFLESAEGGDVNYVNAPMIAQQLGIHVDEVKSNEPIDYAELVNVRASTDGQGASLSGTFYGSVNNPRIVRINDKPVEAVPHGVLFIMSNKDRPGVVGWIGTIMGRHGINIASMSLGRDKAGGQALTVLNLDSAPSEAVLAEIKKDQDILDVRIAKL